MLHNRLTFSLYLGLFGVLLVLDDLALGLTLSVQLKATSVPGSVVEIHYHSLFIITWRAVHELNTIKEGFELDCVQLDTLGLSWFTLSDLNHKGKPCSKLCGKHIRKSGWLEGHLEGLTPVEVPALTDFPRVKDGQAVRAQLCIAKVL